MILSDEEILQVMTTDVVEGDYYLPHSFARAIEAAILEKIGEPVAWRTIAGTICSHKVWGDDIPLYALPEVKE